MTLKRPAPVWPAGQFCFGSARSGFRGVTQSCRRGSRKAFAGRLVRTTHPGCEGKLLHQRHRQASLNVGSCCLGPSSQQPSWAAALSSASPRLRALSGRFAVAGALPGRLSCMVALRESLTISCFSCPTLLLLLSLLFVVLIFVSFLTAAFCRQTPGFLPRTFILRIHA